MTVLETDAHFGYAQGQIPPPKAERIDTLRPVAICLALSRLLVPALRLSSTYLSSFALDFLRLQLCDRSRLYSFTSAVIY